MLKKRLFLRHFLTSFVNFYITKAFDMAFSLNFWMNGSRFFIAELAFCERDKNHKFANFKNSQESLFQIKSRFTLSDYCTA